MENLIQKHLHDPKALEELFQNDKSRFKRSFDLLYPSIKEHPIAQTWHSRLHYTGKSISWNYGKELLLVILLGLASGLVAKIPDFFSLQPDSFYPSNSGFILFPSLCFYFLWLHKASIKQWVGIAIAMGIALLYINTLPTSATSDTYILACIHLPLLLWSLAGISFTIHGLKNTTYRIQYLRFNGDLVVITTIILLAGGILSGITIGLFELIHLNIAEFYFKNIALIGASAAPLAGAYLIKNNPQLVKNVSPVIAKVFTPLVLIMLICYLTAMIRSNVDPYQDRDFLILFNILLIGVMAIILFSIAETAKTRNRFQLMALLLLSIVTLFINSIACSAILFRISEWGFTPNRIAVLGGNLLMLTNLILVGYQLYKALKEKNDIDEVEVVIAKFLPIYALWTFIIVFILPLIFGFK